MTKPSLLLLGAGGHAKACIDVIEQEDRFSIGGLIGLSIEVGSEVLGYPVLGTDDDVIKLLKEFRFALISIGQIKTSIHRIRLFNLLEQTGCTLPTVISPNAYVSKHANVGYGTIIMHGAVVNAGVTIKRNCIINSQSLVEHDSMVGDHCHIATGVTINSGVEIDNGTFIGSNTSVRQCVRIGENCVIGMGQRVLSDCEPGSCLPKI